MNKLKPETQASVIRALIEGNSVRSTERMTGVHRDSILRLQGRVGAACAQLMDETMVNLDLKRVQVDEIWGYVGKKQRHILPTDDANEVGDQWVFVALDAETKVVPCHLVGKRTGENAKQFVCDLAGRVRNRIQLSSDQLSSYVEAVEAGFGGAVDYGRIVKWYETEPAGAGRYSPPKVKRVSKDVVVGDPDEKHISTSYIERQNLTIRMCQRRFTRLTNAFSKKLENLKAAVSLHFGYYNFVRRHRTLRVTPAMAAGVTDRLWTIEDLVEMTGW